MVESLLKTPEPHSHLKMKKPSILSILLVISAITQYGSGAEDYKAITDDLTKLISKLEFEKFEGDHVLDQYVDTLNDYTTYKIGGIGKKGANLYERKSNDHHREAIVLLPNEDKIISKNTKKIYVGLRRAGIDDNRYYVFYIYVSDPAPNEKGAVKVGGQDKIIEYDNWVDRQNRALAQERHFGWSECSSSAFVPCQTHQKPDHSSKPTGSGKVRASKEPKEKKPLETVKAESGFDADENVDFFWDLEDDSQQARFIEMISGLLGGVLSPVLSVASGVLSNVPIVGDLLAGLLGGGGDGLLGSLLGRKKREVPAENGPNHGRTMQLAMLTALSQKTDTLIAEGLMKTDVHSYPGWKTMEHPSGLKPGDSLDKEDDAFVGFGTCPYEQATQADYDKAKTEEEVVLALAKALRTDCGKRKVGFFNSLTKDGYLKLNADKTFDISTDYKSLKEEKLSPRRRSELLRGLELSEFSKAYKAELYSKSPVKAPSNSHISRRVHVFGETILEAIEKVKTDLKAHEIKLLRGLATTVKTVFIKLIQDYEVINQCKECKDDLDVNRADQIHTMTILKFIIHGLGPLEKSPSTVREVFKKFNETNSAIIETRVETYL